MITCPEEVVYVYSDHHYLHSEWDSVNRKYTNFRDSVLPFACCDVTKQNTIDTAERHYAKNDNNIPVMKRDFINVAKTGYKIHSIGHYNNRDYFNIVTPEGFYTELHLNDVLDCMKNEGIKDGEILSPLIWVRDRTTFLVRQNSEQHKKAVENGKDK